MAEQDHTGGYPDRHIGRLEGRLDALISAIEGLRASVESDRSKLYTAVHDMNVRLSAVEAGLRGLRAEVTEDIKPKVAVFTKAIGVAAAAGASVGIASTIIRTLIGL